VHGASRADYVGGGGVMRCWMTCLWIFLILIKVYEIGDGRCAAGITEFSNCGSRIEKADFSKPYDYIRYGAYQTQYWIEVWTNYPEKNGELITRMTWRPCL